MKPKESIIKILKEILQENSDESILEFREAVNTSDEDLMNNKIF